jgi:hypothetical protein
LGNYGAGNILDLKKLGELMVEHGLVIRAIPYQRTYHVELRHKDQYFNNEKYPEVTVCQPDGFNREMLRVTEKNNQGGKFIITQKRDQGTIINSWGKPVVFHDTIEEAIEYTMPGEAT